jgi:hypothetical protein
MSFKSRQAVGFSVVWCRPGGEPRLRVEAYIDTGAADSTAEEWGAGDHCRLLIEVSG